MFPIKVFRNRRLAKPTAGVRTRGFASRCTVPASCGVKCTQNTGQACQSGEQHANLQRGARSCRQQHLLRAPRLVGTSAPCNCQETVAGSISFLKKAIHHSGNEKAEGRFQKAFHFNTALSKSHHLPCAEGRSHGAGSDTEPPAAGGRFCRLQADSNSAKRREIQQSRQRRGSEFSHLEQRKPTVRQPLRNVPSV